MKTRQDAKLIVLKDLPAEGRDFEFSNESGELNSILKDLIGTNPYQFNFRITPQGNSFDLRGQLESKLDLQCSVCAGDFAFPIKLDLHELIVIERAIGKGDQMTKANHAHEWVEGGPDYMILSNDTFDVGEYAHEAIALAEPMRPLCAPERPSGCAQSSQKVERTWLSYGETDKEAAALRDNPFRVLEKIKLKS